MNEPRTSTGYDLSIGRLPGDTINAWLTQQAAFIKSLDSAHMVSTGETTPSCHSPLLSVFHYLNRNISDACCAAHQ
jgi:hypothetical protein